MSTSVDTDIYLVNRGGNSFYVTHENIMAELENTDLLLVNREVNGQWQSYKITGEDFINSIDPADPLILTVSIPTTDPVVGTPVSVTASTSGGTSPYSYTYQWQSKTPTGTWTNISSATSSAYTPVVGDVNNTLRCTVAVTDSASDSESEDTNATGTVVEQHVGVVTTSTRFVNTNESYLSRTFLAGDTELWTFSCWIKRALLEDSQRIFSGGTAQTDAGYTSLLFPNQDTFNIEGWTTAWEVSAAVYRDPLAWYHLCVQFDASAATKWTAWMNGVEIPWESGGSAPSTTGINTASVHSIGADVAASQSTPRGPLSGYISDIYFIDAQAKTASDFARTHPATGKWVPKAYTGDYDSNGGVNSFHLPMDRSVTTNPIGTDDSGEGNDWTTHNLVADTGGPYDWKETLTTSHSSFSSGQGPEKAFDGTASGGLNMCQANGANGNLVWDFSGFNLSGEMRIWVGNLGADIKDGADNSLGSSSGSGWITLSPYCENFVDEKIIIDTDVTGDAPSLAAVEIAGVILVDAAGLDLLSDSPDDVDNSIYGAGNYATLNPLIPNASTLSNGNLTASGTTDLPTIVPGIQPLDDGAYGYWYYEIDGTGYTWDGTADDFTALAGNYNFGQRTFANTPSSNEFTLCTYNLATPVITDPTESTETVLYAGNNGTTTINSLAYTPGLVWIKNLTNDDDGHAWFNPISDVGERLDSDTENGLSNEPTTLTAFSASGFTLGASAAVNATGIDYGAWSWTAGSTAAVTVGAGTIATGVPTLETSVRASSATGFSVSVFIAANSEQSDSAAHGLNDTPKFVIIKSTADTTDWFIYHADFPTPASDYLVFTDSAKQSVSDCWGGGMTSDVIGFRSQVSAEGAMVAFSWCEIDGYSKFSSYTGDGNTSDSGPYVNCGFEVAFLMVKNITASGDWFIIDNKRNPFNDSDTPIFPNTDDPEATSNSRSYDFLSNGFKVRNSTAGGGQTNVLNDVYVFAAFASAPFKYANAH